jgi:hypothetical protein
MENKILEALSQVPALVEATQMSNEIIQEQSKLLAKISERNVHANIPDAELEKVTKAVEERVMATTCSLPDTESLTEELADGVLCKVTEAIMSAVEEKIKNTPFKLEHHHTHATTYDLARYADKGARNWLITLVVLCFTLAASLTGCLWWYFTSDIYYGQQYQQIYSSKYITKEEKNMLVKEIRGTGFLPNEYYDVPKVCQGRINRNKQLIKERREQAEVNKGQFNTIPAIER